MILSSIRRLCISVIVSVTLVYDAKVLLSTPTVVSRTCWVYYLYDEVDMDGLGGGDIPSRNLKNVSSKRFPFAYSAESLLSIGSPFSILPCPSVASETLPTVLFSLSVDWSRPCWIKSCSLDAS